jgi:hypothetical protein
MKREDIYAIEEIERDIALVAGYFLAQGRIDLGDSRAFINDDIPEIAVTFINKYPKFAKAEQHEDYMTKIDSFCEKYLLSHYGNRG